MYAGVVKMKFRKDAVDDAIRVWKEELIPPFKDKPGWKRGYLLVQRDTGSALSVGVYETEEDAVGKDMEAVVKKAFSLMDPMLEEPASRQVYEVAAED